MATSTDRYDDNEIKIILLIQYVAAGMSAIASLMVLICYWISAFFRKHVTFRIVICVAFSDLIWSFGWLLGNPSTEGQTCILQGFLLQLGMIASTLWVLAISWNITRLLTVKNKSKKYLNSLSTKMNVMIWTLSGIISIIPFFTDSYGKSPIHCWIKTNDHWMRIMIGYVPIWITFGVLLYFILQITFCKANNSVAVPVNLKMFPLVFAICFITGTIRRVWDWVSNNDTPFALVTAHVATATLLGLCDAMVLVWNKQLIKYIIGRSTDYIHEDTSGESGESPERTELTLTVEYEEHVSSKEHPVETIEGVDR